MSGPTDTHDLAAGCINLDDHRLKQPRGLTGQSSAKRYPPDSACVRRREFGFHTLWLKRHFLTCDFDGLLTSELRLDRASSATGATKIP